MKWLVYILQQSVASSYGSTARCIAVAAMCMRSTDAEWSYHEKVLWHTCMETDDGLLRSVAWLSATWLSGSKRATS